MPSWIEDQGDGSDTVWQVEGKPGSDCSTQLLRLLAACLNVGHLNIDHSVERADLALGNPQGPDRLATRDDLNRLITFPAPG